MHLASRAPESCARCKNIGKYVEIKKPARYRKDSKEENERGKEAERRQAAATQIVGQMREDKGGEARGGGARSLMREKPNREKLDHAK